MVDERNELVIDVPSSGELWRVTFCRPQSWVVHVIAQLGSEELRSTWALSEDLERRVKLGGFEIEEDALFTAVVRRYLREFPDILAAPSGRKYPVTFRQISPPEPHKPIERVTCEIEDLVLTLAAHRRDQQSHAVHGGTPQRPIIEWRVAEPVLGDTVSTSVKKFYDEYQALSEKVSLPPEQLEAELRRLSILGIQALQSIIPSSSLKDNGKGPAWPLDEAVHLTRIALTDIRCFESIQLDLTPPEPGKGQWLVLLGDNGVGKTTILRALALALLPPRTATSLIDQFMVGAPLARRGTRPREDQAESIVVELTGDRSSTALILGDVQQESIIAKSLPDPLPLVFAYGCRRGGATGGVAREADITPRFGVNTLFNDNASLVHAETWLRKLDHVAQVIDKSEAPFYEAVKQTLVDVLPGVEDIRFERDHMLVIGDAVGEVPIAALSDGYLTTLGWTVDFIARFAEYARLNGHALNGNFAASMPCVVLIDELDLHLHPHWQIGIIRQLREAFPLTTFITTTHNPLTLHGTAPGEVFIIRRTEDGTIEAVQKDLPPGLHADQLLTGEWFGLPSTLDPDTQGLLAKHRRMLF